MYKISIHGCDDSTCFVMHLTDEEVKVIERLSALSKTTSTYGCMPTLEIEKEAKHCSDYKTYELIKEAGLDF